MIDIIQDSKMRLSIFFSFQYHQQTIEKVLDQKQIICFNITKEIWAVFEIRKSECIWSSVEPKISVVITD